MPRTWYLLVVIYFVVGVGGNLDLLDQFYSDYMSFYDLTRPLIILDLDCHMALNLTAKTDTYSVVLFSEGSESINEELSAYLKENFFDYDAVLILATQLGPSFLNVTSSVPFFYSQIPILMDWSTFKSLNLHLRLDTNVVIYEETMNGDGFNLSDIYAIKSRPQIKEQIGTWHNSAGLKVPVPNVLERRTNLGGVTLKNTILPFSVACVVTYDNDGNVFNSTGFLQEILFQVRASLNFTLEESSPADKAWGHFHENTQQWDGMIRQLVDGEMDLASAGLAITTSRSKAVDYGTPLAEIEKTLMVAVNAGNAAEVDVWVYLEIFNGISWALILIMLTTISVLLFTISHIEENYLYYEVLDTKEELSLLGYLSASVLFLVQLSAAVPARSMASRVVVLVGGLGTYFIFAYYTSDLTAWMTSSPPPNPIRSFADVLERQYQVVVVKGTASVRLLSHAPEGSDKRTVFDTTMAGKDVAFVKSVPDAIETVLTKNPKSAIFESELWADYDDRITSLKLIDSVPTYVAFAFQRDSEFLASFNYQIQKMLENGLIPKIRKDWSSRPEVDFSGGMEESPLGFLNLAFPFFVLTLGVIGASLAGCFEKAKIWLCQSRRLKLNHD